MYADQAALVLDADGVVEFLFSEIGIGQHQLAESRQEIVRQGRFLFAFAQLGTAADREYEVQVGVDELLVLVARRTLAAGIIFLRFSAVDKLGQGQGESKAASAALFHEENGMTQPPGAYHPCQLLPELRISDYF